MNYSAKITPTLLIALICLMMTGCVVAPNEQGALIAEREAAYLQRHCRYIDTVSGYSMQTGVKRGEAGVNNAKAEARNEAAEIGGTHIAWIAAAPGTFGSRANARVYACPIDFEDRARVN